MSRALSPGAERIPEIDLLRGIAIAAVVGIHVTWFEVEAAGVGDAAGRAVVLLHLLCGFGVPLFLALSTFALGLRHSAAGGAGEHLAFLGQRAVRLLPAYVTWSMVTALLFHADLVSSPGRVLSMLLLGGADGQFYFVPLLFEIYLLWPLVRPLARASAASAAFGFALAAAGMGASLWCWHLSSVGVVPGAILNPWSWLGYVLLGVAASPRMAAWRRAATRTVLVAATAVATSVAAAWMNHRFLEQLAPPFPPMTTLIASNIFQVAPATYALAAMALAALVAARLPVESLTARAVHVLGAHSYGIFLVHLVVLRLALAPPLAPATAGAVLLVTQTIAIWAGTLAASAALVATLSRWRWTRPLVTNRW